MSRDNSPGRFFGPVDPESLGIPQFVNESFYQILNGLVIQGGKYAATTTGDHNIPFVAPFRQQLLNVQLTRLNTANHVYVVSAGTTLANLRIHVTGGIGDVYWFAIGV